MIYNKIHLLIMLKYNKSFRRFNMPGIEPNGFDLPDLDGHPTKN